MFEYFSENYPWTLATMSAINMGGAISEIDEACRPLRGASLRLDSSAQQAWFESWKKLAERVEALGLVHEAGGQYLSAGSKYRRASLYYLMAERMISSRDPRRIQTYRQGLAAFRKGIQFLREPVEWVEVPFQGKSLPAIFSKAPGPEPSPCIIHFNGFDWIKEFNYFHSAEAFRRRGISLLIADNPGTGGAIRLQSLRLGPNTEAPAAACVDYLETRPDVDPKRIGIAALSLGGYYAPRAAAFEKRLKCCVAWGGFWDLGERIDSRLAGGGGAPSVPDVADQMMWVFGKDTIEEAYVIARQLTLEGVADKITCPLLVVHGENDRQVPLFHAERTFEAAVHSPGRKLKVFTLAEGGAEHCQIDNFSMAVDYIADWVAEILGGNPRGV